MFRDSINKLEKYREATGFKKRQRIDLLSNDKAGGASLLKMAGQPPRNLLDQSAQRLEDKAKCGGMNKRFRTTAGELRVCICNLLTVLLLLPFFAYDYSLRNFSGFYYLYL